MSANFKFQPFGDEDENEEKEKPENPPRQKKTLVPWEISKGEETISKATIHTDESIKPGYLTFISELVSQFSRIQIASVCLGFIFVVILISTIASNGASIQSNSATLEFKINETHKIHGLILRRMEEIKQRQFDSEEFLKEMMRSLLDESSQFAETSLRNFSTSHLESFREAQYRWRGRFDAVDQRLDAAKAASEERAAGLKADINRIASEAEQKRKENSDDLIQRMQGVRRWLSDEIERKTRAKTEELRSELEEMEDQMVRDREGTKETIGKLLEDLKDNRKNFDEIIRDLSRDTCSDPLLHHCSSSANCINTIKGYMCSCKHGYHGDGRTCQDINECDAAFGNECHSNGDCTNTAGSYTCACKSGFVGDGKEKCEDVNECDTKPCHKLATCENEPGSFKCICASGYSGDGINSCDDIDECLSRGGVAYHECHTDALCNNSIGSYICNCKSGFIGDGVNCEDVDECASGVANCSTDATCTNNNGSFSCSCNAGFSGDGETCEDVDECKSPKETACSSDAFCTNKRGSYSCTCKSGFSGDGHNCSDINECDMVNNCSSAATCTNTKGGFTCACLETHKGDGVNCTIDYMKASGNYSFHAPSSRKNWYEAKFACQEKGGYLAIVGDEAEDRLIRSKSGYDSSKKYWVGGKCERRDGPDRNFWVRTDVDFAASYPSTGFANLHSCDSAEDGIVLRGSLNSANAWDDLPASSRNRRIAFICEKDLARGAEKKLYGDSFSSSITDKDCMVE